MQNMLGKVRLYNGKLKCKDNKVGFSLTVYSINREECSALWKKEEK